MHYRKLYSADKTSQELKQIFLGAKYGDYVRCDHCNSDRVKLDGSGTVKTRWRCKNCWKRFSLTSNTFMHGTRKPLRFWYEVIWCFVLNMSAHKSHRLLQIQHHNTILSCYQTIRKALCEFSEASWKKEMGVYEVDEALYGGRWKNLRKKIKKKLRLQGKNKRGRGAKERKQPVFGIYKRNGKVYLELIDNFKADTLEPIIEEIIEEGSVVFSDEYSSYGGLAGLGYIHRVVEHGEGEYVDNDNSVVHVNGMEGFWGLSKTMMHTYKGIREKNWIYYIKEMEFRYNYRELSLEDQVKKIINILMNNFGT